MPLTGETMDEMNFWTELDSEVNHINEQLRSAEAQCSQALLRQAKRYWATLAFDTDTVGLKRVAELAKAYAPLASALPIAALHQVCCTCCVCARARALDG
jgi:dynein heavy chain 1